MRKIAVDALGGDNAPAAIVEGCLEALGEREDLAIQLCGPTERLEKLLEGKEYDKSRLEIVEAPGEITNHDSPAMAVRRKLDSSMVVAMMRLKHGEAEAAVSAGSTGAWLAGGIFKVGRIRGIDRPALAPTLPTMKGTPCLLLDSGANMDCKPEYLRQFALMGTAYMRGVLGQTEPKVGLLNVGAEDEKGNELSKEAYALIKEQEGISFFGNIEGRDALTGDVQVVVTDGFAGNVLLKATEGAIGFIFTQLKSAMTADLPSKLAAAVLKPRLRQLKHKLDYQEYGGAVLLGVDGVMIKAHGSSTAHAFARAILQAASCVDSGLVDSIKRALGSVEQAPGNA